MKTAFEKVYEALDIEKVEIAAIDNSPSEQIIELENGVVLKVYGQFGIDYISIIRMVDGDEVVSECVTDIILPQQSEKLKAAIEEVLKD